MPSSPLGRVCIKFVLVLLRLKGASSHCLILDPSARRSISSIMSSHVTVVNRMRQNAQG
jgi:hypothetical protein